MKQGLDCCGLCWCDVTPAARHLSYVRRCTQCPHRDHAGYPSPCGAARRLTVRHHALRPRPDACRVLHREAKGIRPKDVDPHARPQVRGTSPASAYHRVEFRLRNYRGRQVQQEAPSLKGRYGRHNVRVHTAGSWRSRRTNHTKCSRKRRRKTKLDRTQFGPSNSPASGSHLPVDLCRPVLRSWTRDDLGRRPRCSHVRH